MTTSRLRIATAVLGFTLFAGVSAVAATTRTAGPSPLSACHLSGSVCTYKNGSSLTGCEEWLPTGWYNTVFISPYCQGYQEN